MRALERLCTANVPNGVFQKCVFENFPDLLHQHKILLISFLLPPGLWLRCHLLGNSPYPMSLTEAWFLLVENLLLSEQQPHLGHVFDIDGT